jgi:hypothetical protein
LSVVCAKDGSKEEKKENEKDKEEKGKDKEEKGKDKGKDEKPIFDYYDLDEERAKELAGEGPKNVEYENLNCDTYGDTYDDYLDYN